MCNSYHKYWLTLSTVGILRKNMLREGLDQNWHPFIFSIPPYERVKKIKKRVVMKFNAPHGSSESGLLWLAYTAREEFQVSYLGKRVGKVNISLVGSWNCLLENLILLVYFVITILLVKKELMVKWSIFNWSPLSGNIQNSSNQHVILGQGVIIILPLFLFLVFFLP